VTGRPVTEAARAAGTLLGKPTLPRGLLAHALVSLWWSAVLARVLPTRHRAGWGAAAGIAIHVLDMEVIGRAVPNVRDLARRPQLADHVVFGALVGAVLSDQERRAGGHTSRMREM
jgi:hypothetical protein